MNILCSMKITQSTIHRQSLLFRALMHPTRIAILEILRQREECVCHIEAVLQLRQAYLSQQLAVLRKAGLIYDRRDGLNIFYRIAHPEVLSLLDTAAAMVGGTQLDFTAAQCCVCPQCQVQPSVSLTLEQIA